MEAAYMKHTLKSQQRLIDKIPQDLLEEIKGVKSRGMDR